MERHNPTLWHRKENSIGPYFRTVKQSLPGGRDRVTTSGLTAWRKSSHPQREVVTMTQDHLSRCHSPGPGSGRSRSDRGHEAGIPVANRERVQPTETEHTERSKDGLRSSKFTFGFDGHWRIGRDIPSTPTPGLVAAIGARRPHAASTKGIRRARTV